MRAKPLALLWLLLAIPGLYLLALLFYSVLVRFPYPYDLEWMEGGMLTHALRYLSGHDIFEPPSVDFVPYLYTPLYPAVLAGLGRIVGLSYQLGRAVSIASMVCVTALSAWAVLRETKPRAAAFCAAACTIGFFAAAYPWVEGWYDIARADMFFLALGVSGLVLLYPPGKNVSHKRIVLSALLLSLSFFAKQTGVLLVGAAGAALLIINWRRLPTFVVVSGLIGGGGSLLLNRLTDGWFWIYVFKYHQQHDTNMDRFRASFANILGHFPILTCALFGTLVLVLVARVAFGTLPSSARGFLFWTWMFACGCVIGALGWATQWAHFNAYIPAVALGAIAGGTAIAAFRDTLAMLLFPKARHFGIALGIAMAVELALSTWAPKKLLPTRADEQAGARLIKRLRDIPGDIFIPFHPWYAHLAGKRVFAHRMGVLDVTYSPPGAKKRETLPAVARTVAQLTDSFRQSRFDAVILDDRAQPHELPGLSMYYRLDATLGRAPRVVTGARTVPRAIWVPKTDTRLPEGASVLFDFESGRLDGWSRTGNAWGETPVTSALGKQGTVGGYRGRYFVSSLHGEDVATGTLLSPEFTIRKRVLMFRIGGGKDTARLRVELRLPEGTVLRSATGPGSELMTRIEWRVDDLIGKTVRVALVDEAKGAYGHLTADEVWETD